MSVLPQGKDPLPVIPFTSLLAVCIKRCSDPQPGEVYHDQALKESCPNEPIWCSLWAALSLALLANGQFWSFIGLATRCLTLNSIARPLSRTKGICRVCTGPSKTSDRRATGFTLYQLNMTKQKDSATHSVIWRHFQRFSPSCIETSPFAKSLIAFFMPSWDVSSSQPREFASAPSFLIH